MQLCGYSSAANLNKFARLGDVFAPQILSGPIGICFDAGLFESTRNALWPYKAALGDQISSRAFRKSRAVPDMHM